MSNSLSQVCQRALYLVQGRRGACGTGKTKRWDRNAEKLMSTISIVIKRGRAVAWVAPFALPSGFRT